MATDDSEENDRLAARYSILLRWSDEDNAYLATLPEWTDENSRPMTHGHTLIKAVNSARSLLRALVMWQLQDGKPLPKPDVYVNEHDDEYEDDDEDSDASTTEA